MQKINKKGFTLVELVIVIAVIAILAGVLIGTFAGVISRAEQSKAVQEWKATVDEAYVEFVADYHEVPSYVTVNGKTITFRKDKSVETDKALPTVTYTVASTEGKDLATVSNRYNSFVILDETNKVYFVWNNNDGTYAVISNNNPLGTSDSIAYSFTHIDDNVTDDVLVSSELQTLTYNGVTYYGLPVNP